MSDQFFKTHKETKAWLDKMGVDEYIIRDDLTVDVAGEVILTHEAMEYFPVRFGVVSGEFYCNKNQLISLNGAPRECRDFDCSNNQLTSLEGAPLECRSFYCQHNHLTNLVGAPKTCKDFYCYGNRLTNLKGAPEKCHKFGCNDNALINLAGAPASCVHFRCAGNPDLADTSAIPDGCEFICDHDVVVKNQAARQLNGLVTDVIGTGGAPSPRSGRLL